jgi:hypothetical protein
VPCGQCDGSLRPYSRIVYIYIYIYIYIHLTVESLNNAETIARQWSGEHVSAIRKQRATIGTLLGVVSFCVVGGNIGIRVKWKNHTTVGVDG